MDKKCDWRLYINRKDRKESYFLQDRCIQWDLQNGNTIKYGFNDEYVDIKLHKDMYLAATFNNEDVADSFNLDTLHGENREENIYSKYKNHHATLIILKNYVCILIETNDNQLLHSGKILVSKKAIQKALLELETSITLRDFYFELSPCRLSKRVSD